MTNTGTWYYRLSKPARKWIRIAVVLAIIALIAFLLTPSRLVNSAVVPALPDDLDNYLATSEAEVAVQYPLISGTEKRIRWQVPGKRTEFAVVYLHGFSASRQEIAPTTELIADALDANLFETRLTGHGRVDGAMLEMQAEDWLADATEALTVGARIGERIILIGTSTGGTLALAMTGHPSMQEVESIVVISPNFGPDDPAAQWLTRPAGPLLARAMLGETRSWEPRNEEQARYWSTSYPTRAIVEVMRLVDLANSHLPLQLDQPLLVLLSPNDGVVSPRLMLEALAKIDAPRKEVRQYDEVGDLMNHVLAGDILSPENTDAVVAAIVEFVRREPT